MARRISGHQAILGIISIIVAILHFGSLASIALLIIALIVGIWSLL